MGGVQDTIHCYDAVVFDSGSILRFKEIYGQTCHCDIIAVKIRFELICFVTDGVIKLGHFHS